MGNSMKKGSVIKSNLFGCSNCGDEKNLCLTPNTYSEIRVGEMQGNNIYMTNKTPNFNYFDSPEMHITPNEYIRSYSFSNRNNNIYTNNDINMNINLNNFSNQKNNNFKEEDISKFSTEKFESNPKIIELKNLLGENNNFILTEKESFYIKNIVSQNYLTRKLLHYKDNS